MQFDLGPELDSRGRLVSWMRSRITTFGPQMPYSFTPEQICLQALARNVWRRRGAAKSTSLPFNEETITETMLLDLKLHFPGQVTIQPFSKAKEAKTGADWQWTFVSADGKWSWSMLVQAKRLDDRDLNYDSIWRFIGGARQPLNRRRQIDVLIATASRWKMEPVYAFYNHLDDTSRIPQNCKTISQIGLPLHDSWGIALASAHNVLGVDPAQAFDVHRNHSLPFHCLLCSGATGRKGASGSAGAAARALSRLTFETTRHALVDPEDGETLRPIEGLDEISRRAEEIARVENLDERDERAEALGREFSGIAGVVILRDSPDGS